MGKNRILSRRQPNLAVAIRVGKTRELLNLFRIDPAGWNAKTYGGQPGLFLCGHPDVVGVIGTTHISSLKCEFITHARGKFLPQSGNSPFFNQESKPAFGAGFARAVIAENLD